MKSKRNLVALGLAATMAQGGVVWAAQIPDCIYAAPLLYGEINIVVPQTLPDEEYAANCLSRQIEQWSDLSIQFETVGNVETAQALLEELTAQIVIVDDLRHAGLEQIQVAASAFWPEGQEPGANAYAEPNFETLAHGAFSTSSFEYHGLDELRSELSSYNPAALEAIGQDGAQHFMIVNIACE